VIQPTYNARNRLGDGCLERANSGLSKFGKAAVARMNELGIVVDVAHVGIRTSLETIVASEAPVIVSHGNARAVTESRRNLNDEQIAAVAESGGVIGVCAFPAFVAPEAPDLERLLDHLGLDRELSLLMHDWGGMIGMAYAARHPARIARLVVSNTAAFHKPVSKPMPRALAICRDSLLGAFLVRGMNVFCHATAWIGCKRQVMPGELRKAYVAPYDSWNHRIAILRFVQDIPLRSGDRSYELVSWVQDRLHLLSSVPMLVLWGMKDFVFDHHFLDEWVSRFPTARVHRFPRAGHYLFEDEADAINGLLPAFLAAHPRIQEHVG